MSMKSYPVIDLAATGRNIRRLRMERGLTDGFYCTGDFASGRFINSSGIKLQIIGYGTSSDLAYSQQRRKAASDYAKEHGISAVKGEK